jgi:murein DD-endopeptidase MepM/ murein hydrolase activator NlpD
MSKKILTRYFSHAMLVIFIMVASLPIVGQIHAQAQTNTINDLQNKISDRSQRIAELEKEIAGYQSDLADTTKQKSTLQATVKALELARKKLAKEVSLATNRIGVVSDTIDILKSDIGTKEVKIEKLNIVTADNIRTLSQNQDITLIEIALSENTLSSFLDKAENITSFQKKIIATATELGVEKKGLEVDKSKTEEQKKQLVGYKAELADKQKLVEATKAEQNSLLIVTKNKEVSYQKMLADKNALKNTFEQDLLNYESQLKYQIDPTLLPKAGTQALSWPLAKITITQLFGVTDFAKAHKRLYNGKGHNGVDFAASIGTAVLSASDGVVTGTGNTDTVCRGASYGKWVLIQHNNGLSTLYGHLSLIKVSAGDTLHTGDVIAYSGATGYVTGPHLHFTVFASQGVKVQSLKSKSCSGTYTIPIGSFESYLNPIDYLPS